MNAQHWYSRNPRPVFRLLALLAFALATPGCDEEGTTGPLPDGTSDYAIVLNSFALTLTVFPVDSPDAARTIELGPLGTPVSMAVRGGTAVVPLGVVPAARIVDLERGVIAGTVPLPQGSGATGVVILDDSLALVANPDLNSITPILYDRGDTLPAMPVHDYPHVLLASGGRVFVASAHLDENFTPTRSGSLTVLDASTLEVVDTVRLSGTGPGDMTLAGDRLYVLHNGTFDVPSGSLSEVDPDALVEVRHVPGFGHFPGGIAALPDGSLLVASFAYGIAHWSPASGFLLPPASAVRPDGAAVFDVAVDGDGRVYALDPRDYEQPGRVLLLDQSLRLTGQVQAGTVPVDIRFTRF